MLSIERRERIDVERTRFGLAKLAHHREPEEQHTLMSPPLAERAAVVGQLRRVRVQPRQRAVVFQVVLEPFGPLREADAPPHRPQRVLQALVVALPPLSQRRSEAHETGKIVGPRVALHLDELTRRRRQLGIPLKLEHPPDLLGHPPAEQRPQGVHLRAHLLALRGGKGSSNAVHTSGCKPS
ncbi:MAG: hypothetical protein AAF721_24225 [Myxococcota bacterium]